MLSRDGRTFLPPLCSIISGGGGSQGKHGLNSKREVVPEVLTVRGYQLTALLIVDPHILSLKKMEQCTSTIAIMLSKGGARILKMFRHTVGS